MSKFSSKKKIRKEAGNFLKDHDLFGHTVHFNFNRQGDTHNTEFGGFCSFLIKMCVAVYVILNLKKLILSEGDDTSSEVFLVAHEAG
jgi:hypothetical protein